jgi:tetratricopeptide (TPR) repeat protein
MTRHVTAAVPGRRREWAIGLLLVALTAASYWGVWGNGFIFDDDVYIAHNQHVQRGLNAADAAWAFTSTYASNWHPLTWLSLQLDNQLYGLNPGNGGPDRPPQPGYHATNLLLHAANAVLLFLVLARMTGAAWCSAAVAAFFAVHPAHVESVAWVTERKDVLSTLFWILTLGAYARYAQRPGWGRYCLVVVALALGLLAKSMLVTLPCVLFLLDVWPLRRLPPGRWLRLGSAAPAPGGLACPPVPPWQLIAEKVPLLALAFGASAAMLFTQTGAMSSLQLIPLGVRLENALLAYVGYLRLFVWPSGLAAFYPHRGILALYASHGDPSLAGEAAAAGLLLAGITAAAWWAAPRRPYLLVGWLWYLGTLVPVIGIVQVGSQAMADRYTYVPFIGLSVAVVWGLADLVAAWHVPRAVPAAAAAVALAGCVVASCVQTVYWHDPMSLWGHALDVTQGNYVAHYQLGVALQEQGNVAEAQKHYESALRLNPAYPQPHNNLGVILEAAGRLEEALRHLLTAIQLEPTYADAYNNLGMVLAHMGKADQAADAFSRAVALDPAHVKAHFNLGIVLEKKGRLADAVVQYRAAIGLDPTYANAYNNLGFALQAQGQRAEAVECFRRAVALKPADVGFRTNLAFGLQESGQSGAAAEAFGELVRREPQWPQAAAQQAWALATNPQADQRDGPTAVRLAGKACELTGGRQPAFLDALAAAYAEVGRFPEAVRTERQAMALAAEANRPDQVSDMQRRLSLYERQQPFRGP